MSDELGQVLAEIDGGLVAPFYLLWGEEFLVRKAADELVRHLLPRSALASCASRSALSDSRDGAILLASIRS